MNCGVVETALFSDIAHPVDKVSTVGQIWSVLGIAGWRNEFNLAFPHINVQVFCTNAKYIIYGCLCNKIQRFQFVEQDSSGLLENDTRHSMHIICPASFDLSHLGNNLHLYHMVWIRLASLCCNPLTFAPSIGLEYKSYYYYPMTKREHKRIRKHQFMQL